MDLPLITTDSEFVDLLQHIKARGRFAFDTEFVSEDTFEPVLCLVQVATDECLVAIDPLEVPDFGRFWTLVNDPEMEVVMHAASEDLRICRFQTGQTPKRLFDVQIAAGFVGYSYPLSLGNLLSQTLKVSVFGGETRTDWRRRPLSPSQLRYALDDVRYLLELSEKLKDDLARLGRTEWANSEFADFLDAIEHRDEEERWRKLSGLHQLSRRGLELARRLAELRVEEARRSNRPLRQVMRDDLLVAIAKRQPASRSDLEALRDFNRPHLLSKSSEILGVVASAIKVPPNELPEHAERHDEGPGMTMLVNLLSAAMANCCIQNKLAPGLIGSNSDIKDLIRWNHQGSPPNATPHIAKGWRGEVCGATLIDVLNGRRALRVVDPTGEVPVAVEEVGR